MNPDLRRQTLHYTLIGLFSVVVWGAGLPFVRLVEERIGMGSFAGFSFGLMALLGFAAQSITGDTIPKPVFRNRFFYMRWLFFVLHEGSVLLALAIVQKQNIPFVILLNYLWPTAVILCLVLLKDVSVKRKPFFVAGLITVVGALMIEITGDHGLSLAIFRSASNDIAYALAFGGAIAWGFYNACARRSGDASGAARVIPIFQLTLGILLPLICIGQPHSGSAIPGGWILLSLIGFALLQFLAYWSWDSGIRLGNPVILSLAADVIPWLSLLASHLLLGVAIGSKTALSAVLLAAGASVTRYATFSKSPARPALLEEPAALAPAPQAV